MCEMFPYSWNIVEDETLQEIRAFGIDEESNSVCLRIQEFSPYVYVELPQNWTAVEAGSLGEKIDETIKGKGRPIKKVFTHRYNLYFSNVNKEKKRLSTPYLFLAFRSEHHRRKFGYTMKKPFFINGQKRTFRVHENKASPFLQFISHSKVKSAGWTTFETKTILDKKDRVTQCDKEYVVHWKDVHPIVEAREPGRPIVLSFDLEVNSTDTGSMPDPLKHGDRVFQISCVYGRQGCPQSEWTSVLLTLGSVGNVARDYEVEEYKSEPALFCGFVDLIKRVSANILIGYNIFGFDLPYLISRSKYLKVYNELMSIGLNVDSLATAKEIKWSSSAYQNQQLFFVDAQGRLFIDLHPLVKRDYKLPNYKLDTVAQHELGKEKDPLTAMDIFACYREGVVGGDTDRVAYVGKYCVKDSALVLELFDHFLYWNGLTEMASICSVPISSLYLHGQQIKVYSQVYQYCLENKIVVQSDMYKSNPTDGYQGAYVFTPVPGMYDRVIPFDFASLYPTTIIANNIDYSTFVTDSNVPDAWCNVIEWEEHVGCSCDTTIRKTKPKFVLCGKRRYRFLKEPRGVMPTIALNLLAARKNTRQVMKQLGENDPMYRVLDKRQLAYKVSCNSLYGAFGVREGYLPFMPAAMCTTAMGREYIEKAAKTLEKDYQGEVIYGDTDSALINFTHLKDAPAHEVWDYALKVSDEVSKLFPEPMKLEFEEKIYLQFLTLTKKRYMMTCCKRDGLVALTNEGTPRISNKGVMLSRRDNSESNRKVYSETVGNIFNGEKQDDILYAMLKMLNRLCGHGFPLEEYSINKQVGDIGDFLLSPNPDGKTAQMGSYKVTLLLDEEEKRQEQLLKKNATSEQDFYLRQTPAVVQLAFRMQSRGTPVAPGSRVPYIISQKGDLSALQCDKVEDLEYASRHPAACRPELLYYIKQLVSPMDELLEVVLGIQNFVKHQYKIRKQWEKCRKDVEALFSPKIVIEHEEEHDKSSQ